eukprot:CAMPEP_0201724466 /NCGR_PEP_ID=MMETSP0593-20130828/8218_1 /ASSEMBLY_ACC=CAM_ASM_000672 /TAXON_ID=267983 /ORGANISM="Skeletonema japonicum, Strain CCMP2506" /LENGTH=61 /DNA_ID=CAMNT_0048215743 /DNA_START=275 /DNA_END=458 /DNA_ORIENTATION=+
MARVRSSSTSERVNPRSVAMEPKLRIRRGVLSLAMISSSMFVVVATVGDDDGCDDAIDDDV